MEGADLIWGCRTIYEERRLALSLLFVAYLLTALHLGFSLRGAVKAGQKRWSDGTSWDSACSKVIFPRLFCSSFVVFWWSVAFFHTYHSPLQALVSTTTVTVGWAAASAFIGAFLANVLAGSTPRNVLPRIYLALAFPFSFVTWAFGMTVWYNTF